MTPILAKSTPPGGEPKTLVDHTRDVLDAATALFGSGAMPTRLGRAWLRFFRLDPDADGAAFLANLLAACLFHDWGKANADMDRVLAGGPGPQLFRHEHLSVLLLASEGVDEWVRHRADIDWDVVLAAVGSHHLKFGDREFAVEVPSHSVRVLLDHPDFQEQLVPLVACRLGLPGTPNFPPERYWGFKGDRATFNPTRLRERLRGGRLLELDDACEDHHNHRARMLRAVRAALIAADAAGSGLPRTGRSVDWINDQFMSLPDCDSPFIQEIVLKRVKELAAAGKWKGEAAWDSDAWNEFQKACDALPARALLLAPCGSGKTLAAWRWIAARAKDQHRRVKRVLFLYPTRATATEGFKDYVSWAPESDATLLHGTAGYDLDGMFPAEDPRSGKLFDREDPRLFALRHWKKRAFSATVDQFLGFMSYGYGPVCLLPVLAESVVVVDEVHSFDRAMFSALLGFLKAFDVPVLCMTATLQKGRKHQLQPLVDKVYEDRPGELAEIADAKRYTVSPVAAPEAPGRIQRAIAEGKRVLWVVNQVSRAQAAFRELERVLPVDVPLLCYHSRFKLNDRVDRHKETVEAIKAGRPRAVAVTTQVCEMSLDIDADLLVTEECPITSLIQRMGRCRRGRDELAAKGPGEVLVYKPSDEHVYSKDDLAGLDGFLTFVTGKAAVSQTDLETGLERFGPKTAQAPKLNSFLASGPYAAGGNDSFRDIEASNVQAVLSSDVTKYLAADKTEQPGFVVPVPRKVKPESDSRLPRYLSVADSRHYHPATGFWDLPLR